MLLQPSYLFGVIAVDPVVKHHCLDAPAIEDKTMISVE
jgi:hypothetical protein